MQIRRPPHFGGLGSRKSRECKGPWKLHPEKERVLQNRQNWCFCGVPPISAALEAGNPRITRSLGNGNRKRSGYCKIGNFGAFVGFLPFRRPWKPEIQEIQGALEIASGKGVLLWGSLHFDGSDGKKHGKSTVFLESCWKTEHSPANCTIFAVLRWFPAISTSPTEKWCLVCCYQILLIKCAIYIRPWVDLEVPFISTAPMAANMGNPRFSWKTARKRSIHWQIARFSRFCGGFQQFRHLQRKMGAWFSVMPRMDFGVLSISMAQMAGNTENPRFSWKIAGKLRIHARFSRFCWLPAISTSPTENWCLVFCYQILLIKCAIYIRQRVDLGVPPFQRLRWQETRKIHGFLKLLKDGAFTGKLHDFRGFAGFQQFRHLQRKIGAWFAVIKFCL